jgi:AAA+ superfamily predicted ATPase
MSGLNFQSSTGHIMAHLERIDLLIQAQVQRARVAYQADNAFQGLHISEEEVEALLERPAGLPQWALGQWRDVNIHDAVDRLAAKIGVREQEVSQAANRLRLLDLAKLFELSPFDLDVVLICLAPELDPRYERFYAFLQDDVTRKCPSINLVLDLLCHSFEEKLACRERFLAPSPLVAHRLICLLDDPSVHRPSHLSRHLKIDRRIADYLLGSDEPCLEPSGVMQLAEVSTTFDELVVSSKIKERLVQVADALEDGEQAPFFCFDGPDSVAKRRAAEALCHRAGIPLLVVDAPRLAGASRQEVERTIGLIGREARLQDAAVYWNEVDALLAPGKAFEHGNLLSALAHWQSPVLLAGQQSWRPVGVPRHRHVIRIEFAIPDYDQRVALWARVLQTSTDIAQEEIKGLANVFRLSMAQIDDAAATARSLAFWREPRSARIEPEDLRSACRHNSNHGIGKLAQKIRVRYGWDDIVLPGDQLEQLHEIYNAARYRPVVYERWGFERKLSNGKGLNVLFSGPSGTGKTMAADIIAKELGLDLYKIDLSRVVSKYIGETEKNLSQIFADASTSNAILFFDEADALFGKRSEVKDAHDRFANIEIGYLLQKMEEYDGTVILATNLKNNIDDAFARRMAFSVVFPFPDEKDRLRIWQSSWPVETPRGRDLDLDFMAAQFQLAGGNIKNIGLAAAFLAVADGHLVKMEHLIRATKRELQKMGKVCVEADFGPYYPLVQRAL